MTAIVRGLSGNEVQALLQRDGYNELPSQKSQSALAIFLKVLSEPMLILLLGAGTLYLILGEPKDALMLLTFVLVIVYITFTQERKTERTLEKLRDLSSPRAYVIRDNNRIRIPGREVVVGDIIILQEGDRVPADATIIESSNIFADESLLTGESVPVSKSEWDGTLAFTQPGGDNLPFVYSGSMIVSGRGVARVTATGINTQIGHIGTALSTVVEEETLLKKETAKIVRFFMALGLVLVFLIVAFYGFSQGDWLKGLLAGLTLSMAILPEEFPVVLIIFLTLGAWRLSKRKVLTRRSAAIETLGAATALCVDKTGTITQNIMHLTSIVHEGNAYQLDTLTSRTTPEGVHTVLEYAILASQNDPFDPIEKELKRAGVDMLKDTEHIHTTWELIREYPLQKTLLSLSHVWRSRDKKEFIVASKGAPEAIADICHLTKIQKNALMKHVSALSAKGTRVLGVAKATFNKSSLPDSQHDFIFELVGLVGFADPVRTNIAQSVKEAYQAGMRVIMITGDYPGTACHIARQIGLKNPDSFMTGPELIKSTPGDLRKKIRTINVFARVVPEQKLRIVMALKENGEIVAMTGDGVNDAPALKSAHIGIAMGQRGTDVAREASAIVLLNDDFSSIVAAVRLGRTIFDNLKKAMAYIVAVHIPIAGMAVVPVLLGYPPLLLPAHIAFLELVIDPACSTVFEAEPEDEDVMLLPPRDLKRPLFDTPTIALSLLQGFSVFAVVAGVFFVSIQMGKTDIESRTMAFAALVVSNLLLIITNLSWSKSLIGILRTPNKALYSVVGGAISALVLINAIPFFRDVFHFSPLHTDDIIVISVSGMVGMMWFEFVKRVIRIRAA